MKKLIALLLALVMVTCMATVAFGTEGTTDPDPSTPSEDSSTPSTPTTYDDMNTVTFVKEYLNPNAGVSPAETFTFSHKKVGVTNGGVIDANGTVVSLETMPDLKSVSSAVYTEGQAGQALVTPSGVEYNSLKTITVELPEYQAVGIYEYLIVENCPGGTDANGNTINEIPTTGVVYHANSIKLVVTVIEQNGKVRVAAIHTETEGKKNDMIQNRYESGILSVSKTVTGNMGDKNKEFKVTVTFIAPDADGIKSTISYVEGKTTQTILPEAWNKETNEVSVDIELKDGETITFTNIPASVNYKVEEADYSSEGYDAPVYVYSDDENKLVDKDVYGENKDTVSITNNKDEAVDTGVALDSAPYIVMLVVAMAGVVALVAKKRYEV